MNKNFNVIKITGFKGILLVVFLICCFGAGFMIFPGWICMHLWNYTAGFFLEMPRMTLLHGSILWLIVALSVYAFNRGNLSVSVGTSAPGPMLGNEDRIKEIIKKINEKNSNIIPVSKKENHDNFVDENNDDDRITKE